MIITPSSLDLLTKVRGRLHGYAICTMTRVQGSTEAMNLNLVHPKLDFRFTSNTNSNVNGSTVEQPRLIHPEHGSGGLGALQCLVTSLSQLYCCQTCCLSDAHNIIIVRVGNTLSHAAVAVKHWLPYNQKAAAQKACNVDTVGTNCYGQVR